MDRQRYLVIIVRPPSELVSMTPGRRSSLLIPFSPEAVVASFVEELWKRLARHDGAIPLTAETHDVSLHLEHEAGPIIDIEDLLSDVIIDTQKEKIYAVFSKKRSTASGAQGIQMTPKLAQTSDLQENLAFRIITPSTTKHRDACASLKVPLSTTIRQLHSYITDALGHTPGTPETVEACECNCTLAKEISSGPSDLKHFLVVHGKSIVEKLTLEIATVGCLQQALYARFGQDLETRKRIVYEGATQEPEDSRIYKKTPVVSICSKQRHVPFHARVDLDDSRTRPQVLDLHTSELPIHPACFGSTIEALGLSDLAMNGFVDIYAVFRTPSAELPILRGKSAIFRDLAHWEPSIAQSDRGMAMFLSCLRVFASKLQGMKNDESARDAAYYIFDELFRFPPALRCLHLLVGGQTPTVIDCASLSQSMFQVLKSCLQMDAVTQDPARIFEGSRLLFGFILESARSLHKVIDDGLTEEEKTAKKLRYTSAFHTYDIRDHKTQEPVLHALQTSNGLMEEELFHSLQDGGILAETHLQAFLVQTETDPRLSRFALQSGGTCSEVLVLSAGGLEDCYGSEGSALKLDELCDLLHLADICGRNGLAVHRPTQLASAVAPCLAFDRNAHLAVYTGEQPCGAPGHSSIIFRPQHGEETIDPSVIEQLIAPIIERFEQDGSAVFDAFGGAEVRRMQDPDEIIMFCIDSSASMLEATDFSEVNEESPRLHEQAHSLIEYGNQNALSLEEIKNSLVAHESFGDMVAIVTKTVENRKNSVTTKVLALLTSMLSSEISTKSTELENERQSMFGPVWRTRISGLESDLRTLKAFCHGLKTHEESLVQFLRYRASCVNQEAAQKWTWSPGDPVPAVPGSAMVPRLAYDITEVPSHLRCPISHSLMEDAVEASDGQTYSRSAIQQWFAIRKTSPLHGAPLDDLSLTVKPEIRGEVASWIAGGATRSTSHVITVIFDSRVGSFARTIAGATSLRDLYKLAYRGLKARFEAFQLSYGGIRLSESTVLNVSTVGLRDSDHITLRIPEDADILREGPQISSRRVQNVLPEMCLVKVFSDTKKELFGFWVPRDTTDTFASIIWKYWRYLAGNHTEPHIMRLLTKVKDIGDGWFNASRRKATEKLAADFTTAQCTGQLEAESVFSGVRSSSVGSQSNHKILKVFVQEPVKAGWDDRLTRLDVLKQMFEALINRMLAYNYKNHVGLVKFSSQSQVVMPISHVLENFRRATNELKGGGDTALWDALALAGDQIQQYASRFPEAKKRIVVISDGMDTSSTTNTSHSIASDLFRKGISVDSVSLGAEVNMDLRTLSYLLGSYRFHPTSLTNALAMCEMEPFLSLSQRPPIAYPLENVAYLDTNHFKIRFRNSRRQATATLVTGDTVPPIKEHPNMGDDFVQLTALVSGRNVIGPGVTAPASNGSGRSRLRVPRLMNEIKTIAARGRHAKYDIYISTADVSFWKIVVEGPDDSPYSEGVFLLYLHADDGYPTFAPKARFVTKIIHPNVNVHGRICHSIFDRDWTSDTSMGAILDTIYGLLYQPESSDPVNTTTTLGFFHDPVEFSEAARQHARKHASMTREEWKAELLGE